MELKINNNMLMCKIPKILRNSRIGVKVYNNNKKCVNPKIKLRH